MIIPNQRHKFYMPKDVAYLNCAYMSPLMNSVTEAANRGIAFKQQPWTYRGDDFFTYSEAYRELAAQLIHTQSENIAIIPSASYGLQIAANNLTLSKDGEILVLEDQFPSNIYSWQEKAKSCGGHIRTVMRPADYDWTKAVLGAISNQTEILALPATHWADGGCLDLVAIGEAARNIGAALVLDLTQSLGVVPFSVADVRPDYMVVAGYKWLLGPYSLGFIYIAPNHQSGLPLEHNWMNRAGSEDFSRLVDYQEGFQLGARRFDMGEKSNPAQLMAASAALTQLLKWGVENICTTLGVRNLKIAEQARAIGLTLPPDHLRSPHFLGLGFPNGVPNGLAETLAAKKIFVSIRGHSVRVTPHLYNTDADIDLLMEVMENL